MNWLQIFQWSRCHLGDVFKCKELRKQCRTMKHVCVTVDFCCEHLKGRVLIGKRYGQRECKKLLPRALSIFLHWVNSEPVHILGTGEHSSTVIRGGSTEAGIRKSFPPPLPPLAWGSGSSQPQGRATGSTPLPGRLCPGTPSPPPSSA